MKKTATVNIFLALTVMSLTGCKIKQEVAQKEEIVGVGGITPGIERNYTASELEISRRICSNLKKKREFFGTLNNGEQFRFRAELRNCDNGIYNADLFLADISNASSTGPEYLASRDNYFRDVVTDQSGVIKQMCDAVIQSDKVSNVVLSDNFKYFVNFLIADGYDRFEVTKAKKNVRGGFDTISAEAVSVVGQKIQAPTKFFGVEKERARYTICNGSNYKTVKQTWIEATNF
ncbi:MAG: hypothetical protein ACXVLQ_02645 [Bacteriovorax sp.]